MQNIEDIYNQYFGVVYKYLFCLTHDDNFTEELTQDTFFKALKSLNSFKGDCKIQVWLCQIAKHLWFDELKRRRRYVSLDEEEDNLVAFENTELMAIENENRRKLFESIKKLDKITQEVILLRINGDLSFKEIGEILGKTETWARVTFYRGKQKLKEVEDYGKEKTM